MYCIRNSLVVQWLGLITFSSLITAIPDQELRFPQVARMAKRKKKKAAA